MQGNAFNRNAGSGAFNSAFTSNQPFNESGSTKTFGQNQQRGAFNAFDRAIGQISNRSSNFNQGGFNKPVAIKIPSNKPVAIKPPSNDPFDKAIAEPFHTPHISPFDRSSNTPANQHQSSFSRPQKSAFGPSASLLDWAIDESVHSRPFNAPKKQDTPFWNPKPTNTLLDQAIAGPTHPHNSPFANKQSNNVQPSPFVKPSNSFNQPPSNSFNQPLVNSFNQPPVNSFNQPPVNSFNQPPVNSFNQPPVNSFNQPPVNSFNQPPVNSFNQPPVNSFQQPPVNSFQQPPVNSFNQPPVNSFNQPVVNSFNQPPVNSFNQPPVNSFNQPVVNSFNQPPANSFNQPVANPFGPSPFGQSPATKHVSPFSKTSNTQSNRRTPFDQSIASANKSALKLNVIKPTQSKVSIVPHSKHKGRRLSGPYERPAKAPVYKRLGKAVEDKKPTPAPVPAPVPAPAPAREQPKAKELVTKLPVLKSGPLEPPPLPNKIVASSFLVKDPGRGTSEKRAQRFGAYKVVYKEFKERRAIERKQAIRDGLIPNPDEQTSLEDAIDFRGSCLLKCPEFEMLERDMQNDLDDLEKDSLGNIDPDKAVKKYRRSAAGGEQPLPSDVRTPAALNKTLDYLVDEILANNRIDKCHKFVRDRTRSIRQDFTLQNIRDLNAVATHERIARFHILSLHEMCEYDEGTFSLPQEMEQLHKTLISLMEFYDDLREEGIETENEAEFRAYHIISQIKDEDIAQRSMRLPVYIFNSQYVTRALEFRALSQRNNEILESSSRRNKPENIEACQNFYSYFFKLIADPSTSFLMACLLETHFSDIRKGALKAMNASYMMKAGGVQAEHVRQVLAYDDIKQLFKEAVLYGIVIDNSLGEPTLSFGQKHYSEKFFVFKEPLSNPSQRKSLLLVEPKKAGRTFRDIVNGINPHATPLPNQNVFATRVNPLNPQAIANDDVITILDFNLSELTDPACKKKKKEEQYAEIKNQAALASELAEQERKKLQLLMEKKKQEELVRQEALRAEEELKKKEQQEKEEIMRKQEMEKERDREAQRQEALLKEQREKIMANMRLKVLRSQARQRLFNQILGQVIREESRVIAIKNVRKRRFTKKIGLPWLERARSKITKRESLVEKKKQRWHFNMFMVTHNPYIPSDDTIYNAIPEHATPQGIHERTTQSIQAEKIALEDVNPDTSQSSIWKAEDFSKNIYPRIREKMMGKDELEGSKRTWRLLINAPDTESDSAIWLRRKFDLDDMFFRNDALYQAFDIKLNLITPDTQIACDHAYQTGAVIFSLPESKNDKTPIESLKYWSNNKKRLDKLVQDLHQHNPGLKVPVLFTYFPDSSLTESTLEKIPKYLGLETNHLISDYHILVMNPLTISKRITEEVNWLSRSLTI